MVERENMPKMFREVTYSHNGWYTWEFIGGLYNNERKPEDIPDDKQQIHNPRIPYSNSPDDVIDFEKWLKENSLRNNASRYIYSISDGNTICEVGVGLISGERRGQGWEEENSVARIRIFPPEGEVPAGLVKALEMCGYSKDESTD